MTQPTRRDFLKQAGGAAAALTLGTTAAAFGAAKEDGMKFSICNETFYDLKWPQERIFQFAAACGYQGVEIAPFTINTDVTKISAAERTALRKAADSAGIQICGLHWILSKTTQGFNLTSADPEVRARTAKYLGELARLCAELGGDVMIFGSPMQRNRPQTKEDTMSMVEGYRNATDVLKAAVPSLEATGVTIAMEPLATWETNFILTAADAVRLAKMVGSPHVSFMLDCKAMWAMEPMPIPCVIRTQKSPFVHFHANDPNLQGPGFGQLDFVPIFRALKEVKYDRWVSVEVFDYSPGPEKLARDSIKYMKQCLAKA
ncbi:MAG: sugar phosphate isomerase/epimerase [Pirellulales bacterium]|nr:sugar phosphate isomerase/epimerase [Pirellulales bacterium]